MDRQTEEIFEQLVNQMAAAEGITEQLKADNQMAWVGKMNNLRSRAFEVVAAGMFALANRWYTKMSKKRKGVRRFALPSGFYSLIHGLSVCSFSLRSLLQRGG